MKKVEGFTATAPKISTGYLEYCLWIDGDGSALFQITKNDTETRKPGTYSNLIFRIADFINLQEFNEVSGINPISFKKEISNDRNMPAFIKAVLSHLLSEK